MQDVEHLEAGRIGKRDVGHQAFSEEGGPAPARPIEELIGNDDVERPERLAPRPPIRSPLLRPDLYFHALLRRVLDAALDRAYADLRGQSRRTIKSEGSERK